MGLFNNLFQRQGPPLPPPGLSRMPPPQALMRAGGAPGPQSTAQQLEERIAQLEGEMEEASVLLETLLRLLAENGIVNRAKIIARAKELGAQSVEELLGAETPASGDGQSEHPAGGGASPAAAAAPSAPVQPVFKKPFVAKRKWDDAAGEAPPSGPQ